MVLSRNFLTMLAISYIALCAQTTTPETSRTKIGPSVATWITIEILGFIKEPSKDLAQASSTESVQPSAISRFLSKDDLSVAIQEKTSRSSTTTLVTPVARSSPARLDTKSQHLSLNAGHSRILTDKSKTATFTRPTRTTIVTTSAFLDSTTGQNLLASVFSLSAVPPFYTSKNWTDEGGGNTSTFGTTPFSQLPSVYATSSNMSIFTGFGKPIYLNLPRYILLLASALPLIILVMV